MADSLLLVRCNHCGGAIRMGETCDCRESGPPLDALDRAQRTLRRMAAEFAFNTPRTVLVRANDRFAAEILATRLDEQGCKDDANLVRRLAGL